MNVLHFVFILGLFYTVHGKCMKPVPMKNFDINKFSGPFYIAAIDARNPTEAPAFDISTCGKQTVTLQSKRATLGKWKVDLILGNITSDLGGPFYLPIINRGLIKFFYQSRNFTFDYTVLCTDYTNFHAAYACADVTPDYTSEFVLFFLRDMTKYDEIVTKPELQKCYEAVTKKPLKQIRKIPYDNCPPEYYQ